MLTEEQIRTEIVRLAKPYTKYPNNFSQWDAEPHVIYGLAWALLGHKPQSPYLTNWHRLHALLKTECGIPCEIVPARSSSEWRWDEAWMKARGLTTE
jgi:hypothetical protein